MRLLGKGRPVGHVVGLLVAASVFVAAPAAYATPRMSGSGATTKAHWVQVTSPATGLLHDISCASPSSCVGVGFADNGDIAVTETWNGRGWKASRPVTPTGSTSALFEGVSCASAKLCVAVGLYGEDSEDLPLAEAWNGSSWKLLETTGVGASSTFAAVSCPSVKNCWAVGEANDKPLAEHWTGGSFSVVSTVSKGQFTTLNGISCRSGTCIAVGGDTLGALIERSTGKGFSAVSTGATPKNTTGELWAVSCPTAKYCVATGESDGKKGSIQTLTEIYKGKRFSTVASPDPTHLTIPYNSLYGISCTSTTSCWAAGQGGAFAFAGGNPTSKDRSTITVHWNGKAWSVATSANPANRPSALFAVSCSRTTRHGGRLSGAFDQPEDAGRGAEKLKAPRPNGTLGAMATASVTIRTKPG